MPEPFGENLWHQDKDEVGVGGSNINMLLSSPGAITAILNMLIDNLDTVGDTTFLNAVIDATYPPGTYKWQAHSTPDFGFLATDGTAVSRTTYARLFAKVGTTYGAGDGTTTFNLPNVKGRALVHQDTGDAYWNSMGESRGANTATLAITHMPNHDHLYAGIGTQFTQDNSGDPHTHTVDSHDHNGGTGIHAHTLQGVVRTDSTSHTHDNTADQIAGRPNGGTLAFVDNPPETTSVGQANSFQTPGTSNESDPHLHEMPGHDHGVVAQGSGTAFDITQKSIVGFCTIRY